MNISPVNNVNFGKKAVAYCSVKQKDGSGKRSATLYQMNPYDLGDYDEVISSSHTAPIAFSFAQATHKDSYSKFYVLKDDNSDSVISCAKTSRHLARNGKYEGFYTSIDEIGGNNNYNDSMTPMTSYIAQKAEKTGDLFVLTAFRADEGVDLKKQKFSKTKSGFWSLPEKRYSVVAEIAEKRNQMDIIG